jgi:hypothetical protein
MAYGMLTSALLGAGTGLVKFGMDKVARSMEEEAKVKAEAEREARIEEAAIRSENRAATREDTKYNKLRADTLADKETQYAQDYIVKGEDAQRHQDEKIADELRAQKWAVNPDNPEYKAKDLAMQASKQSIEASKQSIEASKSTVENQNIARQVANLELSNKQEISNLRDQLKTETDKTQQDKIYNRLLILEGKSTKPSFETIDVPMYDEKGEQIKDENTGVLKYRKQLISINPVTQEIKKIGEESAARYNLEDAKAIATAEANDKFGKRNTTFFDTDGDKDNSKAYDDFVKARTSVWVSQEKAKDGMLNSKGANKTTDVTDKDLNSLYADKVNIGGMRKPNSQEFEPSQGVAKDLRKMDYQLTLYGTGESKNVPKPLTTLRETISTWSPKSDNNDTERLINDASKLLNIKPDDKIDLTDSAVRGQLMKALVKQEHGGQIKGDINKIYQYIDETYGSTPLTNPSNSSKKIISITQEK